MFGKGRRVTDNRWAASAMREPGRADRVAAPGADPRLVHQGKGQGCRPAEDGRGRASQDSVGFHAPVLRHDRRRLAARSMPRDSRHANSRTRRSRGAPADAHGRRIRAASLADAMRKHPKAFDDLYTNMVAAGEAGGILDTILKRLATYIEKNVKLQGQVKGAMVYPVAVLVIAGLVVTIILWKSYRPSRRCSKGLGRGAAIADASRDLDVEHSDSHAALPRRRPHPRRHRVPAILRDLRRAARRRPPHSQDAIIGTIMQKIAVARFNAHAVDAHFLGPSRYWTGSTSRPRQPATRSSRTRSWSCARRSRAA